MYATARAESRLVWCGKLLEGRVKLQKNTPSIKLEKNLKIEEVNFNLRKRLIFSVISSTIIVKYQTKRKP